MPETYALHFVYLLSSFPSLGKCNSLSGENVQILLHSKSVFTDSSFGNEFCQLLWHVGSIDKLIWKEFQQLNYMQFVHGKCHYQKHRTGYHSISTSMFTQVYSEVNHTLFNGACSQGSEYSLCIFLLMSATQRVMLYHHVVLPLP